MPTNMDNKERTNRRILNLFKTKRRKTIAAIESANQALDKAKPNQKERNRISRITNEE